MAKGPKGHIHLIHRSFRNNKYRKTEKVGEKENVDKGTRMSPSGINENNTNVLFSFTEMELAQESIPTAQVPQLQLSTCCLICHCYPLTPPFPPLSSFQIWRNRLYLPNRLMLIMLQRPLESLPYGLRLEKKHRNNNKNVISTSAVSLALRTLSEWR